MKSICFKKLQQPTKSTLFPYTTLFRSLDAVAPVAVVPSPNFQAYEATVPSTSVDAVASNAAFRPVVVAASRAVGGRLGASPTPPAAACAVTLAAVSAVGYSATSSSRPEK